MDKSSTDVRTPRNATELRAALRIGRPNVTREVRIFSHASSTRRGSDRFDVSVHAKSKLHITVYSGIPFLKLTQGHSSNVTVIFTSSWGNSLEIEPGCGARVIVPDRRIKATVWGDDSDLELSLPEGEHRVYWPSKYPKLTDI